MSTLLRRPDTPLLHYRKVPTGPYFALLGFNQILLEETPVVVAVVVAGYGTPRTRRAPVVPGAVDDAVLHRRRPHGGEILGGAVTRVVDAAEAEEGHAAVGHFENRVVRGGADGARVSAGRRRLFRRG